MRAALDEVRPYLESHGGDVELVGVEDGVVRLRLEGSCSGCPSSTVTLKLAIEDAIHKAAPDVERIEAEGVVAEAGPALLQLEVADAPAEAAAGRGGERRRPELASGESLARAGRRRAGALPRARRDSLYAYRPAARAAASRSRAAAAEAGELACPGCGTRYDVRRAGRSLDGAGLHLDAGPAARGRGAG